MSPSDLRAGMVARFRFTNGIRTFNIEEEGYVSQDGRWLAFCKKGGGRMAVCFGHRKTGVRPELISVTDASGQPVYVRDGVGADLDYCSSTGEPLDPDVDIYQPGVSE